MSRKTTMYFAAVAAVSIGALGAGAAMGLPSLGGPGTRFDPALGGPQNPVEARRFQFEFGGGRDAGGPQIMIRGGGRFAHGGLQQRRGGEDRNLDLTADEAGTLIAAQLIMQGNDRLKVGAVAPQGEDTYVVDVVTLEDSLVMQIEIDRDTGRRSPVR